MTILKRRICNKHLNLSVDEETYEILKNYRISAFLRTMVRVVEENPNILPKCTLDELKLPSEGDTSEVHTTKQ